MLAKTLAAALILASVSSALTVKADAGPGAQSSQNQGEYSWMDRASKTTDGGN